MKIGRSLLIVGTAMIVCLVLASAGRAEVAVQYRINATSFKQVQAGDTLTFNLYSDSGCTNLLFTQALSADNSAITYQQAKFVKVKGGATPPQVIILTAELSTSPSLGPVLMKVTGTGIVPVGDDCQVQGGEPFSSNYFQSDDLNTSSANVGSTFTRIDEFVTFVKERADTRVEVRLNSRATGGIFAGGASGVHFQVRIDGNPPTLGNEAAITTSGSIDFVSIFAVFDGLAPGQHKVSVWARTGGGTSTGVILDPGGWGGQIIVKETF